MLLLIAACGGGSGDTVATTGTGGDTGNPSGSGPAPFGFPPAPAPAPSGFPPAPAPAPSGFPPAPAPAPVPAPASQARLTWTVTFADAEGQAGPQGLNRLGQLAFTSSTAQGPRARFFDGTALHEIEGVAAVAVAVNEAGRVAGHFPGSFTRAFAWDARTQPAPVPSGGVLDTSPDVSSLATSVNASGVIAGTESDRRNFPGGAIRWTPFSGPPQFLANLEPGPPAASGEGRFINASGAIAGVATVPGGAFHAVFWRAGGSAVQDIGTFGGAASTPTALNDAGQVAGHADTADGRQHAFLWSEGGGLRDLGTLGGPTSTAAALDALGRVVGTADMPDGTTVAFLWRDGLMLPLGTLGGRTSAASAINASGLIAGNAETATGVQHAFVWSESMHMMDLNEHVSGLPAAPLTSVVALADDGSVLALAGSTLVLLRPTSGP